ncbi:hypothetical protein [Novosphingobium sp.]|uniref:hypothetical protein n=1 Tax=Novosphingobium sp. TaxID=1874826 RepID=UPI0038BDFF5B
MNGGPRIIAIESALSDQEAEPASSGLAMRGDEVTDDDPFAADEALAPARSGIGSWWPPLLGGLLAVGWTAFFVLANWPAMRDGADAQRWSGWIAAWATPVLLILVGLLLALRLSKREAGRFVDAAQALARESEKLEARLVATNTELALARDFIAAQSRDLESLGRLAVERISGNAARLQELIVSNGEQVDRIGAVSGTALDNMEKLRGQLPVIANAAKDVTNSIGNAGRAAHLQLEDLAVGFQRLNEFGVASERQVGQVRDRVDAALVAFSAASEEIGTVAHERFDAFASTVEEHRARIDASERAAIEALRARVEALVHEIADQREVVSRAEEDALHALAGRVALLRDDGNRTIETLRRAIEELGRDHDGLLAGSRQRLSAFEDSAAALTRRLVDEAGSLDGEVQARRERLEAELNAQAGLLAQRLGEIDHGIGQRRAAMAAQAAEAISALEMRLGGLDAEIEAARNRQAAAAEALAARCSAVETRVAALALTLEASVGQGTRTAEAVDRSLAMLGARLGESREALASTDRDIVALTDGAVRLLELIQSSADHTRTQLPEALRSSEAGLARIEDRVVGLRDTLREAGESGRALSERIAAGKTDLGVTLSDMAILHEAFVTRAAQQQIQLDTLRQALASARSESEGLSDVVRNHLGEATAAEIESLSQRLGDSAQSAIVRVLQGRGAELVARLEQAIDSAAAASRDTALLMRDQLTKVDELAGNLESRVNRARERAEEQVDNDLARRTALITESLNSTAIDIAKVLSADVSETAWASYLRGDRGIFTRRAVSLLDNGEVKIVQQHYETDLMFRDHVNRYIHDFEGMLRQLLSTRDGNALGVTLLSSDMGKLYVALAQGIERLRT